MYVEKNHRQSLHQYLSNGVSYMQNECELTVPNPAETYPIDSPEALDQACKNHIQLASTSDFLILALSESPASSAGDVQIKSGIG